MTADRLADRHDAAVRKAALVGRSDRVRIELTGPDRAKVLHNLTTNDIKRLTPGRGCEAFLTSGQGRTLAFLLVHAEDDRLLLRSDPGTAEAILGHLSKYGLFEDVTPVDISSGTGEWHLFGPLADDVARSAGLPVPEADLGIARDGEIRIIRESPTGLPGLTILWPSAVDTESVGKLRKAIDQHGGALVDHETFEVLRIEAGMPVFGPDVTPANLPQEANRDARAISFVKGCYLGQETVARLDAMGHVNKILVGAVAENEAAPPPGATLEADGKVVGTVTSSGFSPGWTRAVILGYVKTSHAGPGSALVVNWEGRTTRAVVHAWPMRPES